MGSATCNVCTTGCMELLSWEFWGAYLFKVRPTIRTERRRRQSILTVAQRPRSTFTFGPRPRSTFSFSRRPRFIFAFSQRPRSILGFGRCLRSNFKVNSRGCRLRIRRWKKHICRCQLGWTVVTRAKMILPHQLPKWHLLQRLTSVFVTLLSPRRLHWAEDTNIKRLEFMGCVGRKADKILRGRFHHPFEGPSAEGPNIRASSLRRSFLSSSRSPRLTCVENSRNPERCTTS